MIKKMVNGKFITAAWLLSRLTVILATGLIVFAVFMNDIPVFSTIFLAALVLARALLEWLITENYIKDNGGDSD